MPSFPSRYLFGKKSTNAINIISGISILGISVGTAALILVMSVLNGFEGLIKGLINSFNPDIKITLVEGKTFNYDTILIHKLNRAVGKICYPANPDGNFIHPFIEETALLEYKGIKDFATLKGVDSSYSISVNGIKDKISEGRWMLQTAMGPGAVIGSGVRNKLAISVDDEFEKLIAYMPDANGNPLVPFKKRSLIPSGIFSLQQEYDNKYVFVDLAFLQDLLNKPNQVSGFEVMIYPNYPKNKVIQQVKQILGPAYKVLDRDQQDAAFYKLMRIEKWVSYAILSFVLVLVAFNIVGALWMIVLEKKKDIMILKSMGMNNQFVRKIFLNTGLLITGLGILSGMFLAGVLYVLQIQYGIVPIPEGFLVDRYPIALKFIDFVVVGITVTLMGYFASLLPAKKAASLDEQIRYE